MTTCDTCQLHLSDFADGTLAPATAAEVAAHIETCAACLDTVRDFERLREAARSLGPIAPPPFVWRQVSAALPVSPRHARAQWMGLAAALVLITTGAYAVARATTPPTGTASATAMAAGNAASLGAVETVEQEVATAARHYEMAIAQLEAVATRNTPALPPDAAARLQASLSAIDQYIAESRAALVDEPQSEPARNSLFDALQRKVTVLQDSVALIGAADIDGGK